jgi:1,4-dihydroxy-2-naphthoate octaprenyltransferase
VTPTRAWAWHEDELPRAAAYERSLPKERRYFDAVSEARGEPVRPIITGEMAFRRALQAPFLWATCAPVLLGLAIAARSGGFDPLAATLTVVAVAAGYLGLNSGSELFDPLRVVEGTSSIGGYRAGWPGFRQAAADVHDMPASSGICYIVAAAIGLWLLATRGSLALDALALVGLIVGAVYAAAPGRLAHFGLDAAAIAVLCGPVLLLSTYSIQRAGGLTLEAVAVSVIVGLLAGLIVYVKAIPRRVRDAKAGRRTLAVRWSKASVIAGFDAAAATTFVLLVLGVAAGVLPIPALLVLVAIPLALRIHAGLGRSYEELHGLLGTVSANTLLHANVSLMLLLAYLLVVADRILFDLKPYFW